MTRPIMLALAAGCLFACLLACPVARAADEAGTLVVAVPLEVDHGSGLMARGGRLSMAGGVPWQKKGQTYVAVEAENYWDVYWQGVDQSHTSSEQIMDEIRAQAARKSYEHAEASGGKHIERMTTVSWYVHITEPGKYTVWNRMWRPNAGHWVFQQELQRNGTHTVKLEGEPGKWYWQKIGEMDCTRRHYRITVSNFHNGKRLDKIVLSRDPDFVPEGVGPEATPPLKNPTSGDMVFKPVAGLTGATFTRVHLPRANAAGEVSLSASWDEGKTWTPLAGDGVLPGDKQSVAPMVRVEVRADAGGTFPSLELPRMIARAPSANYATLEAETARYLVNIRTGAVGGIDVLGVPDGTIMPAGCEQEPFRVFVKPDNNSFQGGTWLGADAFRMVDKAVEAGQARFNYKAVDYPIEVSLLYKLNPKGYLDASISVTNGYEHDILEVEFPKLAWLRVGSSASDDTLIWPFGTGRKYANPSTQSILSTTYPKAVMPWCNLYDDRAGLYFAAHDANLVSMEMTAGPDPSRTWMSMQMTKRDRIKAGGGRAEFGFAIGAHRGTWHTAAAWYKAWYDRHFPRAEWPQWTQETDGWQFDNISFARPGFNYRHMIEKTFRRAIVHGFRHVQVWGSDSANSCPCYFYPPDDAGGPKAFTEVNDWWRQRGGQIGYYVLPQGPATWVFHEEGDNYFGTAWKDMPDWAVPPGKLEGKAWQWLVDNARYGRPDRREPAPNRKRWTADYAKIEQRGTKNYPWDYTAMSMYSKPWNDWFVGWVMRYIRDFKTSTMYLDTLHTQADIPDYNPHLGLHGEGRGGYLRMLMSKRIAEEGKKIDPDWLPIMEMQCDAYQPWMAQQVGSSSMDSEFMKFTHPDHLQFEGQTGAGWGPKRFKRFNSSWMYGNRLDHREYEGWATEIITMRGWLTRWINDSRFMDDLGLTVSNPELKGKLHRVMHEDGSRGVVAMFWNTARRERHPGNATLTGRQWPDYRVSIDLTPMAEVDDTGTKPEDWIPRRAILVDMGHKPREIHFDTVYRQGRPHVEFMLPARQVNGVLLVRKAAGARKVLVRWDQQDFKQMDVHLLNPGAETASGSVAVRSEAVTFPTSKLDYTLAPGQMKTVSFPYEGGRPPTWASVVHIDATMDGVTRRLFAGAYPFMDNASFEDDTVLPTTDEAASDGKRSLKIPSRYRLRFRLEADTRYRMTLMMRSGKGKTVPQVSYDLQAAARNRVDGRTLNFSVRPALTDDQWTPVSFTFLTPKLYHDGSVYIRVGKGQSVLVDDCRIERLADDAKVDHLPDKPE